MRLIFGFLAALLIAGLVSATMIVHVVPLGDNVGVGGGYVLKVVDIYPPALNNSGGAAFELYKNSSMVTKFKLSEGETKRISLPSSSKLLKVCNNVLEVHLYRVDVGYTLDSKTATFSTDFKYYCLVPKLPYAN
ncbi:MAG: hypothetical protein QXF86_00555 [Candidatus Bilamarchaeaceae archaeon]